CARNAGSCVRKQNGFPVRRNRMNSHRGEEHYTGSNHFPECRARFWSQSVVAAFLLTMMSFGAAPVSAQSRNIEWNDLAKIVSVSDPQISPDGKTIVIVISRPNLEQDRNERELVQIDIASGAQHALTYERKS